MHQKVNSSVSKGATNSFNEMFPLARMIPQAVMHRGYQNQKGANKGGGGERRSKFWSFCENIMTEYPHRISFFHHNSWNGKKAVGANLFALCLKFRIRCEVGIQSTNNL